MRFVAISVAVIYPIRAIVSALMLLFQVGPKEAISDGEFVERATLEKELLEALNEKQSKTVLVFGNRGGGKTTLIRHALSGRRGVINVSLKKTDHDEAQDELIDKLSRRLHVFGTPESESFIERVFAWSPVSKPVVVVSLEAGCGGSALNGVITQAKIWSYEKRDDRGHPRIIVDISGSRAAIEAGLNLEARRVIGVHVGDFTPNEATDYLTPRMPASLDKLQREQLSRDIAEQFDLKVGELQDLCQSLIQTQPTDKKSAKNLLHQQFAKRVELADAGWRFFFRKLEMDGEIPSDIEQSVARLMLEGPQKCAKIIDILKQPGKPRLSPREIGLANADAGTHPLMIDPFGSTVCLSGKAVRAALTERFISNTV